MMDSTSPRTGILLMVCAAACFVTHDAISKHLSVSYPIGQIISLRHISSLLVILLYVQFVSGWPSLRVVNATGQFVRALVFVGSTVSIILSVSLLPLSLATAIIFSSPIFVVALAGPMLGETVGVRRWTAVIVGFIGVLVIVRPGGAVFNWYLLVPVLAALAAGLRDNVTRYLARTESAIAILFWSTILVVLVSSTSFAWGGWRPVAFLDIGWLVVLGILNTVGHFMMIISLRVGDASLVTPFRYTGIVWATLLGIVVWGDYPDRWTVLGACIVIASGLYIIERNERRGQSR